MANRDFYDGLTPDPRFADLADPAAYRPVPDDWIVGLADIVDSTAHIAAGRYKQVNMVGAAVIAAMMNALKGRAFPFVFGGDGASFAVPAGDAEAARAVLSVLRRWVQDEFAMPLRAALVPVTAIRAAGRDLRVARHAASSGADYAMFAGGGLAWAEARMKAGAYAVVPAPEPLAPDLTGLSCRWDNLRARNGLILSLVVLPGPDDAAFARIATEVVALADRLVRGGHPIPAEGPQMHALSPGTAIEAHAARGARPLWLRAAGLIAANLFVWGLFRTGLRMGRFDPSRYRAEIAANADYRKFDDGLKMTLDCDPETRDRLLALLDGAQAAGQVRYGWHEQTEAMVTCIVPSVVRDDHVHFVDGAAGGYAIAAAKIKAATASAP